MTITDPWLGARAPRWQVQLLDRFDAPKDTLRFMDGSAKIATFARLGGNARLVLSAEDVQDVNWFSDRISITYYPRGLNGPSYPVGIYLFDSPLENRGMASAFTVDLMTKVAIIDQDQITETYSLPQGSQIIPAVVDLIESTGETRIAVTDSDVVTSSALTYEAGESKLTIINDLLTSADYSSLWSDGTGQFRVEPYQNPLARPVAFEFVEGETSIHKPEWSREQDVLNVPNRVMVVSPGSDDEPAIIGIAEDNDPNSPYSIPSRGRVIGRTEEVSDMTSVSAANSYAQRLLEGGMSPQATLAVEHAIVPLEPGDLVRFTSGGQERMATIREMTFDLDYGSQCRSLWREVSG